MGELYEQGVPSVALVQIPWPTRGLPTEIFADILLSVLSEVHYDTSINASPALKWLYRYRLSIYHYSHCPGFSMVDSVPTLWVFIDSSVSLNIVDIALERSGVRLLSIRFRPANALTTASSFMNKVAPHIGRWKVVDLRGPAWKYLPQMPAPRLQELILIDPYSEMSRALAKGTFCGELPSLQRLTLDRLPITGPLPTLGRNLRFLTIRQLSGKSGITYTEIHRLLLLHSSLVEVELQASHWSQATPNPETLEDVSLPSLSRFSFTGRGSTDWIRLLQKIRAPNCTSFELVISNLPDAHSDLLQAVEPYFASMITPVSRDLTVSLSFEFDFTLVIGQGDRIFKLEALNPKTDAESVIVWVSELLVRYRPTVTDLELVRYWTLSDKGLSNLFMELPDVTQFRVEGGLEANWRVLGKPVVPAVKGGPAQWLLPAMEKLAVLDQSGKEGEDFIAMIQAREAAAAGTDSTRASAGHQPVRLERLEFQGPVVLGPDARLPKLLGDRFVFERIKYGTP
ncbi:hypothetical protein FRC00_002494 [Tulasnella sp. 408]|nr:hypothetical protein FRC00_002494 [Tulasnella sp. 408]